MVLDKSVLKTFFTKNGVIEKTIGEIICAKIMNKIKNFLIFNSGQNLDTLFTGIKKAKNYNL